MYHGTNLMVDFSKFIHPEQALVVLCSLNSNFHDRKMERSQVKPVQAILDGEVVPIAFFDSWGEYGISSLWLPSENYQSSMSLQVTIFLRYTWQILLC